MSKPGDDPSFGISSGDVLILPERHPACRRREPRSGSGTERENLSGDAKGKGAIGSHREAESTDAPERGGLPRSSAAAAVMAVERRGQVTAVDLGQPVRRDELVVQRKAAAFARWHEPDESRGSRPDLREARGETPRAYSAEAPRALWSGSEVMRPLADPMTEANRFGSGAEGLSTRFSA
jgi:hypothetical protein